MKIDTKLIEAMGGLKVSKDEGGGVVFPNLIGSSINIMGEDMPEHLSGLVYFIAEIAYERGLEVGKAKIQHDLRILLNIK